MKLFDKARCLLLVTFLVGSFLHPVWAQTFPVPYFDAQSQRYGYSNAEQSKIKIEPIFEHATVFQGGYAKVQQEGKFFLINKKGKKVSAFPYDQIGWSSDSTTLSPPLFTGGLIGVQVGKNWGLMDEKGRIVVEPFVHSLDVFQQGISKAGQLADGNRLRFGLVTPEGRWVVEPLYDSLLRSPEEGYITVLQRSSTGQSWLKGLLDRAGNTIVPPKFVNIIPKSEQVFACQLPGKDGKWALYQRSGQPLYPPTLQGVQYFENGKAIAIKDFKYGLLDEQGKELVPFQYGKVQKSESEYSFSPLPHYTLITEKGEVAQTFFFESLKAIGSGVYQFQAAGKWGLVNASGQIFSYGQYAEISVFQGACAIVTDEKRLQGLINQQGEQVLPLAFRNISFDDSGLIRCEDQQGEVNLYDQHGSNLTQGHFQVGAFQDGCYTLREGGRAFFADGTLHPLYQQHVFEEVSPFSSGYAVVQQNGLQGIINRKGQWVIRPYIDRLQVVNAHYFLFEDNGEWGTVNANGIELFKASPEIRKALRPDGLLALRQNGKVGLVNKWGTQILPISYDSISSLVDDRLVRVYAKGQMAYMDTESYIPPQFNAFEGLTLVDEPNEGLFPVQFMGGFGFVDYRGRIRISNQYAEVKSFSEGLAPFRLRKKWGYLDAVEHFVIQPEFDAPGDFIDGKAIVTKEGKKGLIDPTEKTWIPFRYDKIARTPYGNFKIWEDERVGLYDGTTWRILAPLYEAVEDCGKGLVIILRKGKYGLSKSDGESLAYPEYDQIIQNKLDNSFFLIKQAESLRYPIN